MVHKKKQGEDGHFWDEYVPSQDMLQLQADAETISIGLTTPIILRANRSADDKYVVALDREINTISNMQKSEVHKRLKCRRRNSSKKIKGIMSNYL